MQSINNTPPPVNPNFNNKKNINIEIMLNMIYLQLSSNYE